MKTLIRIDRRYRQLSMRLKMFLAYAIPVILVSTLVLSTGQSAMQKAYADRLRGDMEQSLIQADSYLSSYFQSMDHLIQILLGNKTLNDILSGAEFGQHDNAVDIFEEFHQLDNVFESVEFYNNDYRIGMYIPDGLRYANNNFYFYPESTLESVEDYEEAEQAFGMGAGVYRILQDKRTGGIKSRQDYLAQLVPMTVAVEGGGERTFILKAEVRMETVEQILSNAGLTEGTILYLEDSRGKRLAFSGDEDGRVLAEETFATPYGIGNWDPVGLDGQQYYVLQRRINWSSWRLVALVPVVEYREAYGFVLLWGLFMVLAISFIVAVVSMQIARYYTGRINTLNGRMLSLDSGTAKARLALPEGATEDEMDALYRNFDFMLDEVDRLMKEQYKLGRSVSRSEMRALQAQINPHFLYNTLDLINWGALDYGADSVAEIARSLGRFYRLSLNQGRSAISIRDELEHVRVFISLENAHYEGAIHLEVDVPEELMQLACLNITLQPLVENCIVHGIAEFSDIEECRITITAEREGSDIFFDVIDNGHGISPEMAREIVTKKAGSGGHGFGIANVNFRLRLCYGEEYGIRYILGGQGTHARVRIRALYMDELEKLLE